MGFLCVLDEEIWQENSPRKDHLVSCVKCHKGRAGPATHWRLCVCFVIIPGKFPSQDISCSLSDCARPFSESIFLNALFWIFVLFVCALWCHRGPTTLCLSVNWPFPPPLSPAWSWAHPLSPSHCCLVYASFQTRAKSDNSIKLQQTTSHSGRLCIVAKGQMRNTEDMIDDKCCVFLPPGSLFI